MPIVHCGYGMGELTGALVLVLRVVAAPNLNFPTWWHLSMKSSPILSYRLLVPIGYLTERESSGENSN